MPAADPSVLYPRSLYGTQGAGVATTRSDAFGGSFETIPHTGTPPFGEAPLYTDPLDDQSVAPVDPMIDLAAEDEFLHDQINGAPWRGYDLGEWVNPSNPGVPNLGPPNVQDFQSGHSQIVVHNPSAEQGWGLDPAVLLARYPHSENVNPYYARGTHRRNGAMEALPSMVPFGSVTQRSQAGLTRVRGTHGRLRDDPAPVAYSSTIPTHGQAGPLALVPEADEAIYE